MIETEVPGTVKDEAIHNVPEMEDNCTTEVPDVTVEVEANSDDKREVHDKLVVIIPNVEVPDVTVGVRANSDDTIEVNDKLVRSKACGQMFKWEGNLQGHMWFHVGFRPNQCGACGVSLERSGIMDQPVRVHKGRAHGCATCGQRFKFERNSDGHVWFHVCFKPYKGGVCEEGLCCESPCNVDGQGGGRLSLL